MEKLNYSFNDKYNDGQSLVHLINLKLGSNLIGLELGVFKAHTFCTFLSNCPNIEKLYGIDAFLPYVDRLADPPIMWDEKAVDCIKHTAIHNIRFCDNNHKAELIEEDSSKALGLFDDETFDFIFIDTYMTKEQSDKDLCEWYPKLKTGGLFSGHDWDSVLIQQSVLEFRDKEHITAQLSCFDNTWCWIKE